MSAPEPLLTIGEIRESLMDRHSIHYLTDFEQGIALGRLMVDAAVEPDTPLRPALEDAVVAVLRSRRGAGDRLAERMQRVAGRWTR